jgi:hypothetical protein
MKALVIILLVVTACTSSESNEPAADAGPDLRDAGRDSGRVVDASKPPADSGPEFFVPETDCTNNDYRGLGDGVIIEACPCDRFGLGIACCTDGAPYECTTFGWREVSLDGCFEQSDAGIDDDAGEIEPVECSGCTHGALGCWCHFDGTCNDELVCTVGRCGMPTRVTIPRQSRGHSQREPLKAAARAPCKSGALSADPRLGPCARALGDCLASRLRTPYDRRAAQARIRAHGFACNQSDRSKCETMDASPAKPGELPFG